MVSYSAGHKFDSYSCTTAVKSYIAADWRFSFWKYLFKQYEAFWYEVLWNGHCDIILGYLFVTTWSYD